MNDEIKITNIADISSTFKLPTYGFIEMWNPTAKQLTALVPWLEENKTVAFIWVYGEVESIPDYSGVTYSSRYSEPFYLGKTKEEAYKVYSLNRELLVRGV
jgi:hypothetical protein